MKETTGKTGVNNRDVHDNLGIGVCIAVFLYIVHY